VETANSFGFVFWSDLLMGNKLDILTEALSAFIPFFPDEFLVPGKVWLTLQSLLWW